MNTQKEIGKIKILIVDDDTDYRDFLVRSVESFGYDFELAADAFAAREKYMAEKFDLIISDIVMPGMDGVELLKHVKNVQPEIDVVLITGYTAKYTFADIIKRGASDFISKPFTRDILKAKICRIQRERTLLKELRSKTYELRMLSDRLEERVTERTAALSAAGKEIERTKSELSAIFFSNTDGIITIDPHMQVTRKNNVNMKYLNIAEGRPFAAKNNHLQKECYKVLQNTLVNKKGVKDYRVEMDLSAAMQVVMLLNSTLLVDQDKHIWGAF